MEEPRPDISDGATSSLPDRGGLLEVLHVAGRLGMTSFGGPVAHLGYFREEYVVRRRWLDDRAYADLVALCQFLPGPASSQVGIAIGTLRAGFLGGVLAWIGFTLPSALLLVLFAAGVDAFDASGAAWVHGLKIAAVAVVANAVWGMSRTLAPDRPRATMAIAAAAGALASQHPVAQVTIIAVGALIGFRLLHAPAAEAAADAPARLPFARRTAAAAWIVFALLLVMLPVLSKAADVQALYLFDSFYRVGSLVFGGGHVVLPLIEAEVVPRGWMTGDEFIAGYGAAQAVPGPLFSFAAYLGAVSEPSPNGALGATIALVAIYVPSFLLIVGTLPFWAELRAHLGVQAALRGVGAAVVGLLLAALYSPVWTSSILDRGDFAIALIAFGALVVWRLPPYQVVVLSAVGAQLLSYT